MYKKLTNSLIKFINSEKAGGLLLLVCTTLSLILANSTFGAYYLDFWQVKIGRLSLELWINDGLMAIFFLLIGLELKREIYSGELANFRLALLPIIAAIGGMFMPALIHFFFNFGQATQVGFGIPMATDIAFAIGILSMLKNRIPNALIVFVVAFAIIDDLGAIIIIAVFYSANISLPYLAGAILIWGILKFLNRRGVMFILPYLIGGLLIWLCFLKSGIHATIAGVLLAFAIPYSRKDDCLASPSHKLEHFLHKPVSFVIVPIFALANTGIQIDSQWWQSLLSNNSLGITLGLLIGKPLGIFMFCYFAIKLKICSLPEDVSMYHVFGAGILGGIGFTMSIFITNLAFAQDVANITSSKMAVFLASIVAGVVGYLWLRRARITQL